MSSFEYCEGTDACENFHRDGFVLIENAFDPGVLTALHEVAVANFREVMELISSNGLEIGIGIKNGYRDIVQRHAYRFEMPYKMDTEEFSVITNNKMVMDVVRNILGEDCVVINKSLLISLPGAQDQAWHIDGPHVNINKYEKCHCLNVFVPLVSVDMSNGPTEFRPESQIITRNLTKQYLAAFFSKKLKTPVAPSINLGSAMLFDYRVLHRGRANTSETYRPVLVYTFAKSWHVDTLNFPKFSVHDVIKKRQVCEADIIAEDAGLV